DTLISATSGITTLCSPPVTVPSRAPACPRPPRPTFTLFPYTTLFRSRPVAALRLGQAAPLVLPEEDRIIARAMIRSSSGSTSGRSEEQTSELQSPYDLVCRLLLDKEKSTLTKK